MITTCEKCKTSFKLDESRLKPTGSKVRCPKCKEVFVAYPPSPPKPAPSVQPSPPVKKAKGASPEEFDLADIEKMIESDKKSRKSELSEEDLSFELDLDMGLNEPSVKRSDNEDDLSLDIDLDIPDIPKKSENLSDLDDLFKDDDKPSLKPSKDQSKTDKIQAELSLIPDIEKSPPEVDVEFEETDEFAKYGTLEFNVKDMYKTLGIEMDSDEYDKRKSESSGDKKEADTDLDLSDLDEMLGIDEQPVPAVKTKEPQADDIDFDLSELDDVLDTESQPSADVGNEDNSKSAYGAATEIFDINAIAGDEKITASKQEQRESRIFDLDSEEEAENLDLDIDGDFAKVASEDLDLDMSFEPEKSESSANDDFNLELDLETPAEKSADTNLELELEPEKPPELAADDLSLDLDIEAPAVEKPISELKSMKTEAQQKLPEAELDLNLELEPAEAKSSSDAELELTFEPEEDEPEESVDQRKALSDDFELDLSLDSEENKASDEELELTLEEPEAEEESRPEKEASEEFSLDLDIGEPESEAAKSSQITRSKTEVFDLDLNAEEESSGTKKPAKVSSEDKTEVFDLDLEEESVEAPAIEFDEEEKPASEEKSESFDLDFDMEAEMPPAEEKKSEPLKEDEFEFDIEDSEKRAEDSSEEFEFNFDGEHDEELARGNFSDSSLPLKEKAFAEPSTSFDMEEPGHEKKTDTEFVEETPAEDKKPIQKKKFKWQTALAAGAAVLVIALGYFVSQFFDLSKIPVIGGMFATKPGAVVPLENSIKGSFIQNNTAGTLFVITGEVRNEFSKPRDNIEIVGKLYTVGKKLAKTEKVFAGNVLTDQEMVEKDMASIKKILMNPSGKNNSNVKVMPNKSLRFMVVFSELPENLDEFTVEVANSLPSK